MLDEIKKRLQGYEITPITTQNFAQAFEVYESNQAFFQLTQGAHATMESSIGDITAIPPNCTIAQKIYVGIWEYGKIIGILDLIEKFPDENTLWIGLLLVHSNMHGKKIGSEIVNAVLDAAKSAGCKSAQLGVIENNCKAIAFWQRHGFETCRKSDNILVMARDL